MNIINLLQLLSEDRTLDNVQKQLEGKVPQKVIDTVMEYIVCITICVCLILAFLNVTEGLWEASVKKLFKKK